MAYSELPWRPFPGHQAWSWTTLRRGNVFRYVYQRFFIFVTFYVFNVFLIFIWTFYVYVRCCGAVPPWHRRSIMHMRCDRRTVATFSKSSRTAEFGPAFQMDLPRLRDTKFLFNAVQDRSKKASVPKIGSIRSSVSIELRLVTDRMTDTGP